MAVDDTWTDEVVTSQYVSKHHDYTNHTKMGRKKKTFNKVMTNHTLTSIKYSNPEVLQGLEKVKNQMARIETY